MPSRKNSTNRSLLYMNLFLRSPERELIQRYLYCYYPDYCISKLEIALSSLERILSVVIGPSVWFTIFSFFFFHQQIQFYFPFRSLDNKFIIKYWKKFMSPKNVAMFVEIQEFLMNLMTLLSLEQFGHQDMKPMHFRRAKMVECKRTI